MSYIIPVVLTSSSSAASWNPGLDGGTGVCYSNRAGAGIIGYRTRAGYGAEVASYGIEVNGYGALPAVFISFVTVTRDLFILVILVFILLYIVSNMATKVSIWLVNIPLSNVPLFNPE